MFFTQSSGAQLKTSYGEKGNYLSQTIGAALGITFAVYIAHGISGAHLNPAYSLSMCLLRRLQWWKLPFYIIIQFLGSFLSAAAVYVLYYDAIQSYSGGNLTVTGPRETASIFFTLPASYLSIQNGFLDQVMGTAILIICLLAIGDPRNNPVPRGLEPIAVGLLIICLGTTVGSNCGYAINPTRDIGPRIFTYLAGWGTEVFSAGNFWWWVPVVAPMVGSMLGTLLYQLFIGLQHPDVSDDKKQENSHGVFTMENSMAESNHKKCQQEYIQKGIDITMGT